MVASAPGWPYTTDAIPPATHHFALNSASDMEGSLPLNKLAITHGVNSSVTRAKAAGHISARHAAHLEALLAVKLERHVLHEQMS